jgi:TonB family protein
VAIARGAYVNSAAVDPRNPLDPAARRCSILVALRALVGSFLLHATVAVGVVASGRPGHPPNREEANLLLVDVAVDEPPAPLPRAEDEPSLPAPVPQHTHPYPVPASHHAQPHDPAIVHDHTGPIAESKAKEPAEEAAPAVVAEPARMPVFTLPNGGGTGAASAGSHGVAHDHADDAPTYAVSAVSVPAKLAASATAAYPADARAEDLEGDVALEIVVDRTGAVVDARVTKRAGHGFDESALAAIRRYRFSPAARDGHAVRVRMPWTVQFRLR